MKTFLKWSAAIAGVWAGGVLAWSVVEAGRQRMRSALGRAEAIADRTRATLEETEAALHDLRTSV
ncbi:MAG TPA: hypothetical protein VGI12_10080 [Vicinamibacterales bacterium]|jgi:hypothetical protein